MALTSLISAVSSYVSAAGQRLSGHQALARWARSQPCLRGFKGIAELVAACRDGTSQQQDHLLAALLAVAHDDQLAQLAVIAALSRQLSRPVTAWRCAGTRPAELEGLEADLVSCCWQVVVAVADEVARGCAPPPRLGAELAGRAWDAARVYRRKELRANARQVSLGRLDEPASSTGRSAADALAVEIGAAVRAGRISARAAAPVFLTRVAGYSSAEAARRLGVTPAAIRAMRSRAERRLVA